MNIDHQIACVEREIKMRERVYPRWVSAGRMTPQLAERETTTMREVLATLRAVKANDAAHLSAVNEPEKGTNASLEL